MLTHDRVVLHQQANPLGDLERVAIGPSGWTNGTTDGLEDRDEGLENSHLLLLRAQAVKKVEPCRQGCLEILPIQSAPRAVLHEPLEVVQHERNPALDLGLEAGNDRVGDKIVVS